MAGEEARGGRCGDADGAKLAVSTDAPMAALFKNVRRSTGTFSGGFILALL